MFTNNRAALQQVPNINLRSLSLHRSSNGELNQVSEEYDRLRKSLIRANKRRKRNAQSQCRQVMAKFFFPTP